MSTFRFRTLVGVIALALSTAAYTFNAQRAETPIFVEGQFTATLDQDSQRWRLLPMDGQDVELFSPARQCAKGAAIPQGIWLVTRNSAGEPELLAPSVTELPPGHPERVQLMACGQSGDGSPAISVPQLLIDVLAERTGAIYVRG